MSNRWPFCISVYRHECFAWVSVYTDTERTQIFKIIYQTTSNTHVFKLRLKNK